MTSPSLDGRRMRVRSTDAAGVVGAGTRLHFIQEGARIAARYAGGSIRRGWLVGRREDNTVTYRYAQVEASGELHAGRAVCEVHVLSDGRLRMREHFHWTTRPGTGTNEFEEVEVESA